MGRSQLNFSGDRERKLRLFWTALARIYGSSSNSSGITGEFSAIAFKRPRSKILPNVATIDESWCSSQYSNLVRSFLQPIILAFSWCQLSLDRWVQNPYWSLQRPLNLPSNFSLPHACCNRSPLNCGHLRSKLNNDYLIQNKCIFRLSYIKHRKHQGWVKSPDSPHPTNVT